MNFYKPLTGLALWALTLLANAAIYTPIESADARTVVNNASLQTQNYKQLARPYYYESNNYIYALADNFISVFADTGDAGQLQVMQEQLAIPAINAAIKNANKLQFLNIEQQNSLAILLSDAGTTGTPLTFLSRGFSTDSNKLGWQLAVLKVKQKDAAVYQDKITELDGYNLKFADFDNKNLYLAGSNATQNKIFILSNLAATADGVTYDKLVVSEDAAITDATSAIAVSGENIYLLSANKLARFVFKDNKILKQDEFTQGIKAATALSVIKQDNSDYIYIGSSDLQPFEVADTAGLLLLEKRPASSVINIKDTLTSGSFKDVKPISDLYKTGGLMLAVSKQTAQIIFFKITKGLLEVIGTDAVKTNAGAGDKITAPSSVILDASARYFYVASNDKNSSSILRISRVGDLQLSVERLQKKSQPGRTIDFRVSVKNNGSNDVPLVNLQINASHRISNVSGANSQNCQVNSDSASCTSDVISAGKTIIYTFSMRPENIGTASLRVDLSSLHTLKNNKNSQTATVEVGDYHNGALAISPYLLIVFSLLFFSRRYVGW